MLIITRVANASHTTTFNQKSMESQLSASEREFVIRLRLERAHDFFKTPAFIHLNVTNDSRCS